jgi:hypothetical protein
VVIDELRWSGKPRLDHAGDRRDEADQLARVPRVDQDEKAPLGL